MAASSLQLLLLAAASKATAFSTHRGSVPAGVTTSAGLGVWLCSIVSTGVGQLEADSYCCLAAVQACPACLLQAVVNQAAAGENAALRAEVQRLRAENAQLLDKQGPHLEGRPSFGSEAVTPATNRRPQVPLVL